MYTKSPWPQSTAVPVPYPGMQAGGATTMIPGTTGTTFPVPVQPGVGVTPPAVTSGSAVSPTGMIFPPPPREESYVENILRMNLGKVGTFYMTYENNSEWNAKIFKGVVEAAGRDHIVISDPATGRRFLLLTLNLDYVTFDEPLVYNLPFGTMGGGGLPTR